EEMDRHASFEPWVAAEFGRRAIARQDFPAARSTAVALLRASRADPPIGKLASDPQDPREFEGHLLMGMAMRGQGHLNAARTSSDRARKLRAYSAEAFVLAESVFDRKPLPGHRNPCVPAGERYAGTETLEWFFLSDAAAEPVPGKSGIEALGARY